MCSTSIFYCSLCLVVARSGGFQRIYMYGRIMILQQMFTSVSVGYQTVSHITTKGPPCIYPNFVAKSEIVICNSASNQ